MRFSSLCAALAALFVLCATAACLTAKTDDTTETPTPGPSSSPTATPDGPVRVTGVSHGLLPRGSAFTIDGTGFSGVTDVSIGGVAQADYTVDSETQIRIHALADATLVGPHDVVVTAAEGSSAGFTVQVTELTTPMFDPPLIAHGATRIFQFVNFPGFDPAETTSVTLGGVAQAVIDANAGAITFGPVDAATAVGPQTLELANGAVTVAPVMRGVIALAINEIDSDTPGTDTEEFIEISTGVAGASLEGYVLVMYNGGDDESEIPYALDSGGVVTNADGLLLLGNPNVNPDITIPAGDIQNGPDAVALHQGSAFFYPIGTPVGSTNLIDAVVYGTNDPDDTGLLDALLGVGSTQLDESAGAGSATDSISRCDVELLNANGSAFGIGAPSAGLPNPCP